MVYLLTIVSAKGQQSQKGSNMRVPVKIIGAFVVALLLAMCGHGAASRGPATFRPQVTHDVDFAFGVNLDKEQAFKVGDAYVDLVLDAMKVYGDISDKEIAAAVGTAVCGASGEGTSTTGASVSRTQPSRHSAISRRQQTLFIIALYHIDWQIATPSLQFAGIRADSKKQTNP